MSELQINTTQNVKIKFEAADVGARLLAFLIDYAILFGYWLIVYNLLDGFRGMDYWSEKALQIMLYAPMTFYTLTLEIVMGGQTLGKRLMNIKVVKIDGYQASFTDYVIRWFFRIVDIWLFGLGLFVMALNNKSQRLGDMAAGTAVITLKERVSISHTILEEIKQDYKPTYPSVIRLSDNDARIIKETFNNARKSKDYRTLIKLRSKIVEVVDIKRVKHSNDVEFIDTILKDYNYYTQNM